MTGDLLSSLHRPTSEMAHPYRRLRLLGRSKNRSLDAETWYRRGIGHQKRRAGTDSVEALRNALSAGPTRLALCLKIGDAFREQGYFDDALDAFRRACALDPSSAEAYSRVGNVLLEAGDPTQAAQHLEVAASLAPASVDTRVSLAGALIDAARLGEASALVSALVEEGVAKRRVLPLVAKLARQRGDTPRAIRALEEAERLDPNAINTKSELGVLLADAGQPLRAIALLEQVVSARPDAADPLVNLAMAQHARGQSTLALEYLDRAIELAPQSAAAHSNRGIILQTLGRLEQATAAFRTAIRLAPQWAVPHYNLGLALAEAGRIDDAAAAVETAHNLEPSDDNIAAELEALSSRIEMNAAGGRTGTFTGSLRLLSVGDLLQFMRINRRTGLLHLKSDKNSAVLLLIEGRICGGSCPTVESLQGRMAACGVDTEEKPQGAGPAAAITDQYLARRAQQQEQIEDELLGKLLRQQIDDILLEVLRWSKGRFTFEVTAAPESALAPSFHFDVEPILLDALRRLDESRR